MHLGTVAKHSRSQAIASCDSYTSLVLGNLPRASQLDGRTLTMNQLLISPRAFPVTGKRRAELCLLAKFSENCCIQGFFYVTFRTIEQYFSLPLSYWNSLSHIKFLVQNLTLFVFVTGIQTSLVFNSLSKVMTPIAIAMLSEWHKNLSKL